MRRVTARRAESGEGEEGKDSEKDERQKKKLCLCGENELREKQKAARVAKPLNRKCQLLLRFFRIQD